MIFDSPGGFGSERVIGIGMEKQRLCQIADEIPLPPQTIPDPLHPGEFMTRGYFRQRLLAENCRIILKRGSVDTVILDMSKDDWASDVAIQIACTEDIAVGNACPGSIVTRAEFRIALKKRYFCSAGKEPYLPSIAPSEQANMGMPEVRITRSYPGSE